jgi:aminoglycoside phosphotransferase (APT) family kinase protein
VSPSSPGDPDPVAVLAALGISDAADPARITGGADTAIWRVERAGLLYALRVFRADQRETCQREQLAMAAASERGLPVPHVHAAGICEERPALLLSWCPGQPLGHRLLQTPWLALRLGAAFGKMHTQIHAVPAPDALRGDPDDWIRWVGQEEESLQARLRKAAGAAGFLLHLDYHAMNVMTEGQGITSVLDWANARAGDPRADFARTVTILRLSPIRSGFPRLKVIAVRRLLEMGWRAGYARAAGLPQEMALFYAWAGAAMIQDLSPRLNRPGTGITPAVLERVRRWTVRWKHRAGAS